MISTERPKLRRFFATNSKLGDGLIKTKSVIEEIILKKGYKKNKKIPAVKREKSAAQIAAHKPRVTADLKSHFKNRFF
jgi:hypothetical protein